MAVLIQNIPRNGSGDIIDRIKTSQV